VAARGRARDAEIGYFGRGSGVDPAIVDSARQMLIDGSWELAELAKSDAEKLATKWQDLSRIVADAELPFAHENGGYRYLTFAGRLINDVICRREELFGYDVDELSIWSPRTIDFRCVPNDPELLGNEAVESLIEAGELTIFQSMLPTRLLHREVVEPWRRTSCYAQVLQRIVS
jgi:hypothetical protein